MNLKHLTKIAAISALAIAAAYAGKSIAATTTVAQVDTPITIDVTATVANTLTVDWNPVDFGTIGATKSSTDTATLILAPDGTVTDDQGGGYGSGSDAAIAADTSVAGTPGDFQVTSGGVPNSDLYITYTNFVDLTFAGDTFTLDEVIDDAPTPSQSDGTMPPLAIGIVPVDNTGATALVSIGATISTEPGAAALGEPYGDGAYAGAFDLYLSY